jgi:acetyl esterase/lipase
MRTLQILAYILLVGLLSSCVRDLRVDRRIPYADPDGEVLRLNVYQATERPRDPLPAIVAIHGGAWLHGPRAQQWWYLHEFARRGYVVFTVDYRNLPRYPFPYCLYDVKGAVRWVRLHAREYGVDPERIFAFGASAGGHLAAFLATSMPEDGFEGRQNTGTSSEVTAAISLYGAVDLTKYREPPQRRWVNTLWRWYVNNFVKGSIKGSYGQDPFAYASPITYARPFSKPILFIHGKDDSVVDFRQSVDAHERLVELGVPAELVLLDNRGHAFDYIHWRQRKHVFARMLKFLEQHGGVPAGTVFSEKAESLPGIEYIPDK